MGFTNSQGGSLTAIWHPQHPQIKLLVTVSEGFTNGIIVIAHAKSLFEQARVLLKESLSNARSEIHYSFDLWTSPNCKAMMAVIGH